MRNNKRHKPIFYKDQYNPSLLTTDNSFQFREADFQCAYVAM